MRRKGQIPNQVFTYVLAAIIFTAVLIYGYNAIKSFQAKSDYVGLVEFKSGLESTIDEIASTQNVKEKIFEIPHGFNQICFIDMSLSYEQYKTQSACHPNSMTVDPVICNAWQDNVTTNIFLLPLADFGFHTVNIELRDEGGNRKPVLCFDVGNGKLRLRLTGMGDRTRIQEVIG